MGDISAEREIISRVCKLCLSDVRLSIEILIGIGESLTGIIRANISGGVRALVARVACVVLAGIC